MDFLTGVNRNLRDMASAWVAMAATIDDLDIGDEARNALTQALEAQAASVKLTAVSVANAVAAVHASRGSSTEFAALLRGLNGEVTPDFVSEARFAELKKAAAASEAADNIRKNVLRADSSRARKYVSGHSSVMPKDRQRVEVDPAEEDDSPQVSGQLEMERSEQPEQPGQREQRQQSDQAETSEARPWSTTWRKRPFRSYTGPRKR